MFFNSKFFIDFLFLSANFHFIVCIFDHLQTVLPMLKLQKQAVEWFSCFQAILFLFAMQDSFKSLKFCVFTINMEFISNL